MKPFACVVLILLAVSASFAQTHVSGAVSGNWTRSGSPYIVDGNVTIQNATTLTIDSGVVVRITGAQGIYVNGTLNAQYVTFTSSKDTVGGSPAKGNWNYIQVGGGTQNTATLDHCIIKFGGTTSTGSQNGSIYMYSSATVNLISSTIISSNTYGILFDAGTLTLTGSTITSCDWPIIERGNGSVVFNGSNFLTGNAHDGIYLLYSGISSNLVLDTINIPYVFSNFTVNNGATLTIPSGSILKFTQNVWLMIHGTLIAKAAPGARIWFTAYTDDNIGGDTNGDGTQTIPGNRYWGGVEFYDDSNDALSVMRRCQVTFAGSGNYGSVYFANASPTVDSCNFANNYYGLQLVGTSSPTLTYDTIGSSVMTPIAMTVSCNPVFTNNTFSFSDNTYDAIGLLGGDLPSDATIPIRSVTSIPNVTYVLLEDVRVPAGRTLTINPGVVLKGLYYWNRIDISGKLVATAPSNNPIIFTSVRDDNYGNPHDTNKDGTQTSPGITDWGGILFEATSDTLSTLNNCIIKYASVPYYGNAAIGTQNASPIISNCQISNVTYGFWLENTSRPKLTNDSIINTQYTPIAMSVSADPQMTNVSFNNAGWKALGLIGEAVGASGTIRRRDVSGFTNITYVLLDQLTINSGSNISVEPGVVIKMVDGAGIWVNGGFRAKGTVANGQIIFTGLRDDNVGNPGDTNGDGAGSAPSAGNWQTIRYQATSDDSFCWLDSCQIKFAGRSSWGGVTFTDASGRLTHSLILNSAGYGIRCEGASVPTVDNVSLTTCTWDPIAMSLLSDPALTNITFSGNGSQGIYILEGDLSSNASLHKRSVAGFANIAYIIHGLRIGSNAVLTIDPGVVIKNYPDYWAGIVVNGALVAVGTATDHIVITSERDDSKSGDTNNDGTASVPGRGDWWGIQFNASGKDSLNTLRNCEIRYGAGGYSYSNWGLIQAYNCAVKVDSCLLEQSYTGGLGSYGSAHPVMTNTQINNISQVPVMLSMFSTPTWSNISVQNAAYMALGVVPETYSVNDTIPIRSFAGYNNITYLLYGSCGVNSGTIITIPAGIVFKGGSATGGGYFSIDGGLIINGTKAQPVVITDLADDNYGNPPDLQNNGFTTPSTTYGFARINFSNISDDSNCVLKNAVLKYAETGLYTNQASPTFHGIRVENCRWGVSMNGVSNPAVDSCVFNNLERAPLVMSIVSYPRSTSGNVISGTTWRGLRIYDETLSQDFTLVKHDFGGIPNIPYIFGHYEIGTASTITIEPGIVIKFEQYGYFGIHKGLIAEGGSTPDSTIVFTALNDDFYGGDTNGDSTLTAPWIEYWGGLNFANEALDPLCRLSHCVFRYGGSYYSGRAAIYTSSASPTITNCMFNRNRNALYMVGASNPTIHNCDIYESDVANTSGEGGIVNQDKTFLVHAENNWWGDNSGPYHPTLNPGGLGVAVSDSVAFIPWASHGTVQPKAGDVSLNGQIQAYDGSLILKYIVAPGTYPLTAQQQAVGDVTGNGSLSTLDASMILQYVVGLINSFPVETGPAAAPVIAPKAGSSPIAIGTARGDFGTTVTIPVTFNGISNLAGAELVLQYDAKLLTPAAVKPGESLAGMTVEHHEGSGEIHIAMAGPDYRSVDGEALTVTFTIAKNVRGSASAAVALKKAVLNETPVTQLGSAGSVTIAGKPTEYTLSQNYPNPFNPSTTIRYQIPDDGVRVNVTVYNSLGETVTTLVDSRNDAGTHEVRWNGTNSAGTHVGSGIYFYRITVAGVKEFSDVRKMLLVR